jgi:hypothetical protein
VSLSKKSEDCFWFLRQTLVTKGPLSFRVS